MNKNKMQKKDLTTGHGEQGKNEKKQRKQIFETPSNVLLWLSVFFLDTGLKQMKFRGQK